MSRLTHSFAAMRRSMQMSGKAFYIYVEGQTDAFFYDAICSSELKPLGVSHQVVRANQLPGSGGGKNTLVSMFEYLRQRGSLADNFKGKRTTIIFFLDKDIDDLKNKLRKSSHVIYTRYYTIENHIFNHSHISRGIAIAASLEYDLVKAGIGNEEIWRSDIAARWKHWVTLCVFSHKRNINSICNYGKESQINNPCYGNLDLPAYALHRSMLQIASGLSATQFQRSFSRIERQVKTIYDNGEHERIFKGKWYEGFLVEQVKHIAGTIPYDKQHLGGRIKTALIAMLDFDQPWAEHFKKPLRTLAGDYTNSQNLNRKA